MAELTDDLYQELHRLAVARMRRERDGHTLSPTALVHEAYLRLAPQGVASNRAHYLATAALMMRRILTSYARERSMQKRGGAQRPVTLDDAVPGTEVPVDDLVALDALLTKLEAMSHRQAMVVSYRVFGGLTDEETAEVLAVSTPTVRRDWRVARAWLIRELELG